MRIQIVGDVLRITKENSPTNLYIYLIGTKFVETIDTRLLFAKL